MRGPFLSGRALKPAAGGRAWAGCVRAGVRSAEPQIVDHEIVWVGSRVCFTQDAVEVARLAVRALDANV